VSPAGVRRYALHLREDGDAVSARVARMGPADPLAVAIGRPPEDAPRLAGLIFSLCPMAQTAAALGALEAVAGREPAGAQAREALVLAEAVAGAVWRTGMTQAELLGRAPLIDPVRRAREAVSDLVRALFADDWRRIGGVTPRVDRNAATACAKRLRNAHAATRPLADAVIQQAGTIGLGGADRPPSLAPYFAAQDVYAEDLLDRLDAAIAAAREDAAGLIFVDDGDGAAEIATARGPLRHTIRIRNGVIERWRAEAPTDKNFAPGGPLETAAARLAPGAGLAVRARWLIAAFDPCAPAEVLEKEAVDA